MSDRQDKILQFIVENYIKNAEPVGSKFLILNFDLEIGEATVRNEMRFLEEEGFLYHPHTSSGRIPTEKGYKYYIENLMKEKKLSKNDIEEIIEIIKEKNLREKMKKLSKFLAEKTNTAIITSIDKDFIYYTGLSNLFSQPEFRDYNLTINVSNIFDHCENEMCKLNSNLELEKINFLIGEDNPLDKECSLISLKISDFSIINLFGPIRMDYKKNIAYINYLKKLFC